MTINVTLDIPREVLEGVFITAIEGGSNYWYFISEEAYKIITDAVPIDPMKSFSERMFEAVYDKGVTVPVHDVEDPDGEPIGELSKSTMQERLQKCAEQQLWAIQEEIDERGDSTSSDVIFQYLALNGCVYG